MPLNVLMEFALKSEIYCFIHLHSLLRIVFVHNIYYIFAKLSLANIRPRFSNKPIVRSRHRGRCTQKFKNNHFTFLKNTELRLFNRKESQFNSPVQLSSPVVQSNCPVQLSSPILQSNCPVQSSPCFVLCLDKLRKFIYKLMPNCSDWRHRFLSPGSDSLHDRFSLVKRLSVKPGMRNKEWNEEYENTEL